MQSVNCKDSVVEQLTVWGRGSTAAAGVGVHAASGSWQRYAKRIGSDIAIDRMSGLNAGLTCAGLGDLDLRISHSGPPHRECGIQVEQEDMQW